jgi:hypothetical protein
MLDLLKSGPPGSARVRYPELLNLHKPEAAQHLVQFYAKDSTLIESVSYLAGKALAAGDSSVIIATPAHITAIENRLECCSLDLNSLREAGRYESLDAAQTLTQLVVDGVPGQGKFDQTVGAVLGHATESSASGFVFAFGEMVALLCADNRAQAAVSLERLWNSIARQYHFSLYCAYPLVCFGDQPDLDVLSQICAEHSLAVPAETLI